MLSQVIFISKWYPNELDPQLGDFIKKQALAVSKHVPVIAIYPSPSENPRVEINRDGNYCEVLSYYKPNRSKNMITRKLINWKRYRRAFDVGFKAAEVKNLPGTIIHAHILNRSAVLAKQIAKKLKAAWIISEQSSEYLPGQEGRGALKIHIGKILAQQAFSMITPSEFLKENLIKIGFREDIQVINNICFSEEKIFPYPPAKPFNFLVIADFQDEVKNISGVIKAFKEVHDVEPESKLYIIGGGQDEAKLKKVTQKLFLSQFVEFLGRMPQSKVQTHFKDIHCLVVNSWVETFSVVCTEALANGRPVIATRCGGPQEIISEQTGILIEPGNQVELVQAMLSMVNTYQNYNPEALAAEIEHKYSEQTIAKNLIALYEKVLAQT
ncbi:MAG: glycosyltransferase [Luteibaculaceae bacterium]